MLARARIARSAGNTATARTDIHSALEEARAQQAGWPELESQVALCELEDASQHDFSALKVLCTGRTEGRDTPLFRRALQLAA